jgi:hypothetical protein
MKFDGIPEKVGLPARPIGAKPLIVSVGENRRVPDTV